VASGPKMIISQEVVFSGPAKIQRVASGPERETGCWWPRGLLTAPKKSRGMVTGSG